METTDHAQDAPDFPMHRRCPFEPPPEYAKMRETAPLVQVRLPNGSNAWVVTRHAEAQQVLMDPRISTDATMPGFPSMAPAGIPKPTPEAAEQLKRMQQGQFVNLDPPEHDVYRKMVISEFSLGRIKPMRPILEAAANELVDAMISAGSPVDLIPAYASPLSGMAIGELLGVPAKDREFFQSCSTRMLNGHVDPNSAMTAVQELWDYLDQMVTEAEGDPGDNLIGRLSARYFSTGQISHDAMIGMIFMFLIAGAETTASMIPLGVVTLVEHPDQLKLVRDDASRWPAAVEELMRFHTIVDWLAMDRVAIEDLEVGGQTVRAQEGIYILGASANRDARVFERPDDFDIGRNPHEHLAWGYGVHQCLGRNLAQAELEIAYQVLFERLPGLRPAVPFEEVPFKLDGAIYGIRALPVTW